MVRYRLEVGHQHQVKPANIVGAIANEAGLESKYIGRITIFDEHSHIDLPEGMPKDIYRHLKKTWVVGRPLRISRLDEGGAPTTRAGADRRAPKARPKTRRHHP